MSLDDPADPTGAGPAPAQLCGGGYCLTCGGHRRRVRRGQSSAAPLSPARNGPCVVAQLQGLAAAPTSATSPIGCPVLGMGALPGRSGNHGALAQEPPASMAWQARPLSQEGSD